MRQPTSITVKSHIPCDKCNSSDAATLYQNPTDKSQYIKCFACDKTYNVRKGVDNDNMQQNPAEVPKEVPSLEGFKPFNESYRALQKDSLNHYGVTISDDGLVNFPYYSYTSDLLAHKIRFLDKTFTVKHVGPGGFQASGLFGAHLFPKGGKFITVTEGEYDAVAAYELLGSKYACVSLKNGASAKLTQEDKDYLDSFETIVFCGDQDEPGRKAATKFASSFNKSKVIITNLSKGKDANEYVEAIVALEKKGEFNEAADLLKTFTREWWASKPYTPEGLVQGVSTLDLFLAEKEAPSIPYPWPGLDELLHGIRTSELIVLTAGSGVGKTAVLRELAYHIFKNVPNSRIGCMFLEESLKRTVKDLVSIELNTNLRLPESVVDPEKKREAWANVFDNDRWIFWDHFGSNDVDTVCAQVRFIANNFGAKYIFLDHISILVSGDSGGDERKTLDAIMTRLRTLVQELDICLFLVSHLRRSNDSVSHEEGGVTSLSQLRGSAGIGQLADIVVGLERNGQAENHVERNVTTLRILKNRYTGETGPACYLVWDKPSSRLKDYTYQEIQKLIAEEEARYNKDLAAEEEV